MKKLDKKTHNKLDKLVVAGLFLAPKWFNFKGKHIFLVHGLASLLSVTNKSSFHRVAEGASALSFLALGLSKVKMQGRARLFYILSGLGFSALVLMSDYGKKNPKIYAYEQESDADTWTDAAQKAQEDLDSGKPVTDENSKAMEDHSAA